MKLNNFESNLEDRLFELTGSIEAPKWAFEKVRSENSTHRLFWNYLPEKEYSSELVPLNKVCGTHHSSYNRGTWVNYLANSKKYDLHQFNDKSGLINLFKNGHQFSDIEFNKYGDEYYLAGEGNNRLVIAKFGGVEYIRAKVTEYFFDYEFYSSCQYIIEQNINIYVPLYNLGSHRECKIYNLKWWFEIEEIPSSILSEREDVIKFKKSYLSLEANVLSYFSTLVRSFFTNDVRHNHVSKFDRYFNEIKLPLIKHKMKNKPIAKDTIGQLNSNK